MTSKSEYTDQELYNSLDEKLDDIVETIKTLHSRGYKVIIDLDEKPIREYGLDSIKVLPYYSLKVYKEIELK